VWDRVARREIEVCWEFDLVKIYVAVVRGGVVVVGPARAAAGPGYLKDVFEGRLVELVINQGAVNSLVRDPLCWDLNLARDVVQGKEGAEGGGEELSGVRSADEYPV
jgi:hypothetical protein